MRKKTKEEFINDAKQIFGDLYIYDEVDYINGKIKVKIKCQIDGVFYQIPYSHLSGNGCPKCAIRQRANNCRKNLDNFIKEANIVHNFIYTYEEVLIYIN